MSSTETNVATQKHLAAEVVGNRNLEAIDEIFAAGVVDHDPAPDQGEGVEGFRKFFSTLLTAFPDAQITPAHLVTDDDHVAIAYTLTGTHEGEFLGIAPTGRQVTARGVQIARFENGKIVERWGSSDELGILKQLGAKTSAA